MNGELGKHRASKEFGCVRGVVTAVPSRKIDNLLIEGADLASSVTGVQSRRWAAYSQTVESLAIEAAITLMEDLLWTPSSITHLVFVTQTPSNAVPSPAYAVHEALGLPSSCMVLPVNWSCAGYVHGLWLAMRLAEVGQRVLLIVGDTTSTLCDPGDRATAPLFGDAVSATGVMGSGPCTQFILGNDGSGVRHLGTNDQGVLAMDGAEVFNFTLKAVPALVKALHDVSGLGDQYLFHQANAMVLRTLAKRCGLDPAKMPSNIEEFGNCSSASIPLLLCNKVGITNDRLALVGFGAGWAWGACMLQGNTIQVTRLIEVDDRTGRLPVRRD